MHPVVVELNERGHLIVKGLDPRIGTQLGGRVTPHGWAFAGTAGSAANLNASLGPDAVWTAEADAVRERALAAIRARSARTAADLPDLPDPSGTGKPAYPHQRQAFHYSIAQEAAALAIAMGGGKTRIAVAVAAAIGSRQTLVLAPKAVIDDDDVWGKQFRVWAGDSFHVAGRVYNRRTGQPKGSPSVADRRKAIEDGQAQARALAKPFVAVATWDAFWRPQLLDWLLEQDFDLGILDEIHRIKAPGGKASRAADRLRPRMAKRIGLSGTMLPHSRLDAYGIYRALDPAVFGTSYTRFKARYAVTVPLPNAPRAEKVVGWQNEDEFDRKFHSIAYVWEKDRDVLGLEEPVVVDRAVRLTPATWKVYRELEEELIAEIAGGVVLADNALVRFLRLQQVLSGVVKTTEGTKVRIGTEKLDSLADLLEDLPADEPLVTFGRFTDDVQAGHEASGRHKRPSAELSGQRKELEAWKNGEAVDLHVQIQSGGTGIDLTRASYAAYLSAGLELSLFDQSKDRLDRPGQQRFVTFVRFIAEGPRGERTLDHEVYEALDDRRDAITAVYRARGGRG